MKKMFKNVAGIEKHKNVHYIYETSPFLRNFDARLKF